MLTKSGKIYFSSGQTLIETIVALFILIMGVSASVGLAIFAFASSNTIVKQIIATGLAREGLEAVRNMRDTNWLNDTLATNSCYNYQTSTANGASCHLNWLGTNSSPYFCINPSPGSSCNGNRTTRPFIVGFDYSTGGFWSIKAEDNDFGLNLDAANSGNAGFYYPGSNNNGVSCTSSNSGFCRRIEITKLNPAGTPYDTALSGGANQPGPLLEVKSQVWWTDKKCPLVSTYAQGMPCSIELTTFLTNWKNSN